MNKVKIIFIQTMMISTGMLLVLGIEGFIKHINGSDISFSWYYPISIIITGFLCALPTLLFYLNEDGSFGIIKIIGHFILLLLIIIFCGKIFKWYKEADELISMVITYIVIYVSVWFATLWLMKIDDNKINNALKEIQDEE